MTIYRKGSTRSDKSVSYVSFMNYVCSNPECDSGFDVEGHHIIPLSKGGADAFWNLISLCKKCHRSLRLHSHYQDIDVELYTWKCNLELNRFGFYLDEKEPDFKEKLKKVILVCHSEEIAEKFPTTPENKPNLDRKGSNSQKEAENERLLE